MSLNDNQNRRRSIRATRRSQALRHIGFNPRRRTAFTLVELMVTMTVLALLIAIALPAIHKVRENARDTTCRSNLRQIGLGLMQYGTRSNYLCSGAWDWKRDGAVTELGWVADLVHQGVSPGDLMCPSNPSKLSNVYAQMMTFDPTGNPCADSLGGADQTMPDGSVIVNPCRAIFASTEKGKMLDELLLTKKFNTNYAAGWFLVRSEVVIDNKGALVNKKPGCAKTPRERGCTDGPLAMSRIGGYRVSSSVVPIMGCGIKAENGENMLTEKVGDFDAGTFLADSFTDGPRDRTTHKAPVVSGSVGASGWFGPWNQTLQDYRSFAPVHFGPTNGSCNILFLDGSVHAFSDINGDGLLNNGFSASTDSGYTDDQVELPAAQVHSQWSLDPGRLPNR
jgi:prepilin-type N-terminal cleavage/methylation domain-containing protein/prepilin-type processing-associated H-X9-DG protein